MFNFKRKKKEEQVIDKDISWEAKGLYHAGYTPYETAKLLEQPIERIEKLYKVFEQIDVAYAKMIQRELEIMLSKS